MTNNEDCLGYIVAARAYLTRGDYAGALECIDQARKLWEAETAYWQAEMDEVRKFHAWDSWANRNVGA